MVFAIMEVAPGLLLLDAIKPFKTSKELLGVPHPWKMFVWYLRGLLQIAGYQCGSQKSTECSTSVISHFLWLKTSWGGETVMSVLSIREQAKL